MGAGDLVPSRWLLQLIGASTAGPPRTASSIRDVQEIFVACPWACSRLQAHQPATHGHPPPTTRHQGGSNMGVHAAAGLGHEDDFNTEVRHAHTFQYIHFCKPTMS